MFSPASFSRLPINNAHPLILGTRSDRAVAAIRRKPWSLRLDGLRLTAILGPYYGVKRLSRHILRARLDGAYSVFHDRLTPPATEPGQRLKDVWGISNRMHRSAQPLRKALRGIRCCAVFRRVARPLLRDVLRTKNCQKLTPARLVIKRALGGLR